MSSSTTTAVPLVEVIRGGRLECVHLGHVVVCDTDGQILFSAGDPNTSTYFRSSAKPFQAGTLVANGTADHYGFTDEELAVVCASHGAQPLHVACVRSMLAKANVPAEALGCGPHWPMHEPAAAELARRGEAPARIHNNCSGKHTGMLAACRLHGWPLDTYLHAEHPLQQANAETLAAFAGCKPSELPVAIDGCGVPTFFSPLRWVARAFARLANAGTRPDGYEEAADRVVRAICQNPVHVAHEGQFDTVLMQHVGEHVVVKRGAEGLFCAGLRGRGLGLAIKIVDGSARPVPPLASALLETFLPDAPLDVLRRATLSPIRNTRGQAVGELKVVLSA
jgi:L-asparaginase II